MPWAWAPREGHRLEIRSLGSQHNCAADSQGKYVRLLTSLGFLINKMKVRTDLAPFMGRSQWMGA